MKSMVKARLLETLRFQWSHVQNKDPHYT